MGAFAGELVLAAPNKSFSEKPGGGRVCRRSYQGSLANSRRTQLLGSAHNGSLLWHQNASIKSSCTLASLSAVPMDPARAASLPKVEGLAARDKLLSSSTRGWKRKSQRKEGDIQLLSRLQQLDCSSMSGAGQPLARERSFRSLPTARRCCCVHSVPLHRGQRMYRHPGPLRRGKTSDGGRGPCPPPLAWWNDFFSKPEPPEDFPKNLQPNEDGSDEIDELIEDDAKFRAWQRKRQVMEDLKDAQDAGRLPDDRSWEDWLDDSWGNNYNQRYLGGERSGWYEQQPEWEKDGKPRSPPPIPERGMNRTIKELSLLAFFNQEEVEEDITFEERIFRYTSQQTAKIVVVLILVPWFTGMVAHEYLFVPFLDRYVQEVPLAATLLDCREKQKLEMIEELRLERQRVKFEAEIGKTPPLSDEELAEHMHEEAVHLREEVRSGNRKAFANIWSDAIALLVFVLLLVYNPREVEVLRITGDRIFTNVSDMGKAFLIILFTDIFLGYHSESGWETLVEIVLEHYGLEASQASIYIFIAIVPVSIDAFFKLWVFGALRKLSPSAAATFSQMKRH